MLTLNTKESLSMKDKHLKDGKAGENEALAFLKRKGFEIKDINWRFSYYELDLVVQDGDVLVIVEVKTRGTDAFGYPEAAVKSSKKSRIQKAAEAYIELKDWKGEVRFDIVAVIKNENGFSIHHIEDAFYPGL